MAEAGVRIDKWLWHARFVRSRTLAQKLVQSGHVRVNRVPVRVPSHSLKIDDTLTLTLRSRVLVLRVLGFGLRRGPPAEARLLYEIVMDSSRKTPEPTTSDEINTSERP